MPAALALLAAVFFAAALVTTQFGLRHMDGLAGAKISIPSTGMLFSLLLPLSGVDFFGGGNTAGASVFAALGVFFPVAVTLLTYEANLRMGPTIASAIGSTAPLFAVLGAVVFLGEKLGFAQIAATLAIVAGSTVLVWRGGAGGAVLRGAAWLSWCAAALRALAQVIAKFGLLLWPNPYAALLLGYAVSAVVVWGVGACSRRAESRVYTRCGVGWFAVTGTFNGCAVLALYSALNSSGGAVSLVSPIAATYPMFTLVLNAMVLREEPLSVRLIVGVAFMVSGVATLFIA